MKQVDSKNKRPVQVTNDFMVLKAYAGFGKPIFDNALSFVVNSFKQQTGSNNMYIMTAPNKSDERIEEKIKEYDVGDYDKILDYIRGTVVFKNLEGLFDFINFAKNFDFSNLQVKDVDSKNLEILNYGVNSFSLDKKYLNNENIEKYPFLNKNTKLKTSEYMDYKMYMKIPAKSSNNVKDQYIVAEIICILEDFYKFCNLTHYLYEQVRVDVEVKEFTNQDLEHLQEFTKHMIYHIHRHDVIEIYNKKPENKIKLVAIDPTKEQDKNNFFNSLPELSKKDMIKSVKDAVIYKAASKFDTRTVLQVTELFNNSFNVR